MTISTLFQNARTVKTIACYAPVVVGAFDDLDTLANLIAATLNQGHLHVVLMQYPAGPRLQITSEEDYPDQAHDLVEHYIHEGMQVQIANGQEPLPVYLYHCTEEPEPTIIDEPLIERELPF